MPFTVELNFDPQTEGTLYRAWERLAQRGISRGMLDYEARPHVTLSLTDAVDVERFLPWLRDFVVQLRPFSVLFQSIGLFPTDEGVGYFAPTVTRDLLDAHQGFHKALPEELWDVHPYYRPGRWVPHCTAAVELPRECIPDAVAVCMETALPLAGQYTQATRIETMRGRPVRTLATLDFGG